MSFESEYLCSDFDRRLLKLAQEYHARTEAYDKTVCSRGAMPVGGKQMGLIGANALKVRREMFEREVRVLGYKMEEWQAAIVRMAPSTVVK